MEWAHIKVSFFLKKILLSENKTDKSQTQWKVYLPLP